MANVSTLPSAEVAHAEHVQRQHRVLACGAPRATKAASRARPPSPGSHTIGAPQPCSGCWISANVGPARPSAREHRPDAVDARVGRGAPAPTGIVVDIASVISTKGTLIAKIARQDTSPRAGRRRAARRRVAMPLHAVHDPIATPRSAGGKVATMIASAAGVSSAPKTPCSARATTSTSMVGAIAHSAETAPKPADADAEDALLAVEVAQRAADQDQRGEEQQVGVDHPLLAGQPAAEVLLDGGQRDVDDRRVHADDERAHDRRGEREALGPVHALDSTRAVNRRREPAAGSEPAALARLDDARVALVVGVAPAGPGVQHPQQREHQHRDRHARRRRPGRTPRAP